MRRLLDSRHLFKERGVYDFSWATFGGAKANLNLLYSKVLPNISIWSSKWRKTTPWPGSSEALSEWKLRASTRIVTCYDIAWALHWYLGFQQNTLRQTLKVWSHTCPYTCMSRFNLIFGYKQRGPMEGKFVGFLAPLFE